MYFELFSGFDAAEGLLANTYKPILGVAGLVCIVLLSWLMLAMARQRQEIGFWYLAVLFSLVPGIALSTTDPRVVMLPAIGGAILMAHLIRAAAGRAGELFNGRVQRTLAWLSGAYFVVVHILFGFVLVSLLNLYHAFWEEDSSVFHPHYNLSNTQLLDLKDKYVVVVNAPDVFNLMYFPYHSAYNGDPLPESVRALAMGLNKIELTRVSDHVLRIRPEGGFVFHSDDPLPQLSLPALHSSYVAQKLMSFFHDGDHQMQVDSQYQFKELLITVEKVEAGRPLSIRVQLNSEIGEEKWQFLSWDWKAQTYQSLSLPKVGASLVLDGPF
jgi:hypothetical protein